MTPSALYTSAIVPAAALLWRQDSPQARVMLLAIAGQESAWSTRIQIPGGAARSLWQAEKNGAVLNVLTSDATKSLLADVCAALDVPANLDTLFEAIAWNDTLACCLARLQLWSSPIPMPALGDEVGALAMYHSIWRPGAYAPERWPAVYEAALAVVSP